MNFIYKRAEFVTEEAAQCEVVRLIKREVINDGGRNLGITTAEEEALALKEIKVLKDSPLIPSNARQKASANRGLVTIGYSTFSVHKIRGKEKWYLKKSTYFTYKYPYPLITNVLNKDLVTADEEREGDRNEKRHKKRTR